MLKQINNLHVSLTETDGQHEITFHNNDDPIRLPSAPVPVASTWRSFFGQDFEQVIQETDDELLYLGYVQLFGYIVQNYQFEVSGSGVAQDTINSDTVENGTAADVWDNKEYIAQYRDFEQEERDGLMDKLASIPLFQEKKLTVNGKVGGVIVESEPIFDLIYPFNSRSTGVSIDHKETLDSIVPFYSTTQSLLFSEIKLKPGESKSFKVSLPLNEDLPPSYNTRLTGPACDQGYVSIRYSIVIGYLNQKLHGMIPKCVYFPTSVLPKKKEYNIRPYIDKQWKVNPLPKVNYSKDLFISDLSKLVEADLHNLPRMSIQKEIEEDVEVGSTLFQLRVKECQLGHITLSKPYYHIGEDINFSVDINPDEFEGNIRIVGYTVFIEAHENYHGNSEFTNIYKCTQDAKFNTFASSLLSKDIHLPMVQVGNIHLPQYLTPAFVITNFMSLRYYIQFTFNLLEMTPGLTWEEIKLYRFDNSGSEIKLRLPVIVR